MKALDAILTDLSVYSVLLPFILGIFLFKKLDFNSQWMLLLLVLASIAQLASLLPGKARLPFYNLYSMVDAGIWAYIFFKNSRKHIIKTTILATAVLQISMGIYLTLTKGIHSGFFYEMVCLNILLQTLWVLLFFYERYLSEEIDALEKEPIFWFCLGLLIYGPINYFNFAYHGVLQYTRLLHDLFNALMYFIFTIGMYVNIKRVKFKNVSN